MAAETTYTFDRLDADGGAMRPSLENIGGADLVDDETFGAITRDGSEPYSDQLNQRARQIVGCAKMIASVSMTIDWVVGVPTIVALKAPGTAIVVGDFAVAVAGGGTGDFTITWTTTKLPPVSIDPTVTPNALSNTTAVATQTVGSPSATQTRLRVQTYTGGALANVRCTVHVDL